MMPFMLLSRMGTRIHVLDKGPDPPMQRGNLEGMMLVVSCMLLTSIPVGRLQKQLAVTSNFPN